jgi:LysM repeat protein
MIFEQVYKTERERLIESYVYKDPLFEQWQKVGRIIAERKMTEPEILDLFGKIETGLTNKDTGANRTFAGRGKDVATKAFTNTKDAFNSVMSSIQNSAPVQAVDVAYDQATDAVANLTGGQQTKVMQAIKGYRNLVKEYPKASGFAKAALVAIAGLATGGASLPVIAGLTYALDSAIRGDKLSSVLGKGAGATAVTWGAQQVAGALGDLGTDSAGTGGQTISAEELKSMGMQQRPDGTWGVAVGDTLPNGATVIEIHPDYIVSELRPVDTASSLGPGESIVNADTPLPQGATVRCPLGSCNGDAWQVKPGETFSDIAQQIGVPPEELVKLNPKLAAPTELATYTVQAGDNLSTIAARFNTSVGELRGLNPQLAADSGAIGGQSLNPDVIFAGQEITLPPGTPGTNVYAGGVGTSADTMADIAKGNVPDSNISRAASNRIKESVNFKTLPAEQLFDHKLTVMSWALNESVGKPAGQSVHLTTLGVYTVFENVNRYARAVVKEAVGPGRPDLPDEFRPDMSGGAGGYDKSKKGIVGKGLDWLDRATGKVGGALSKFGHQFTTKVTKEKLKMDWHQAGKPSDSDAIAAFLAKQGVPQNVIGDVYSSMSIPAPTPAPVVPSPYGKGDPEQTKVTVAKLSNEKLQSFISKATDPANPHVQIAKAELAKRQAGGAQTQLPYYGINPATKKPWTVDELQAKAAATKQTTPVNTTTTTTTPSTSGATFNASNVMQMPGMQKYAKTAPAAPAKTANFGAGPTGYGKTTTTFKAPAAPTAPTAPTVPAVTAGPGGSYNPKTGAAKIDGKSAVALKDLPAGIQKQLQPQLEATKKQVSKMLESVQTKSDVDRIKKYVDQQFATIGLTENTVRYRKKLMDHITHVGSIRRRMHASSVGN